MIGLVRVHAKVLLDNTGAITRIPALFANQGVVLPLVRYFVAYYHCRSQAWMGATAQAVELLLEYIVANADAFTTSEDMFCGYVRAMYDGTISEKGTDTSGLYWRPRRTANANVLIGAVANFSDWLAKQGLAQPLNPPDLSPSRHDLALAMAAYEHRRSRAFLGHVMPRAQEANPVVRIAPRRTAQIIDNDDRPPTFPEDYFARLITDGFVRRGYKGHVDVIERINVRDALITLLMHGGGLRVSEPFHLWVHDVQIHHEDPTQAVVRIYHPGDGLAPDDWRPPGGKCAKNRADYLKLRYARMPRHLMYGSSEWAGWKHNALDSRETRSMAVTWRSPDYARLFLILWTRWLRERAMRQPNHPYAFIALKHGQRGGGYPGGIYTVSAFLGAHKRAVERIGLVATKANGTTLHGHRHAVGQFLIDSEVSPAAIMKIMHHCSLESQGPYTRPSRSKANELLNRALQRLESDSVEAPKISPVDLIQLFAEKVPGTRRLAQPPRSRKRQ